MDFNIIMNMHVTFCLENNSNIYNSNMHAWIMLYINMYELNHDLALQFNMDHARISSNTRMRRWNPYLGSLNASLEVQFSNLHLNYQAILQDSEQFKVKNLFLSLSTLLVGKA